MSYILTFEESVERFPIGQKIRTTSQTTHLCKCINPSIRGKGIEGTIVGYLRVDNSYYCAFLVKWSLCTHTYVSTDVHGFPNLIYPDEIEIIEKEKKDLPVQESKGRKLIL